MNSLNNSELVLVKGGSFNSTMLNAIARTVSTIFSIGQAVGSALRRVWTKNYC